MCKFIRGWFINESSLFLIIKSLIAYVVRIVIMTLGSIQGNRYRYIPLTPYTLKTQVIFDRDFNKFNYIKIRDTADYSTFAQIYLREDYDIKKLHRYDEIISYYNKLIQNHKTPLIIDCGGNIGLASKFFSDEYKHAKIICIEPDSENINQALINNTSKNIEFLEAAIGSSEGNCKITDPGLGNNGYRVELSSEPGTSILTINKLIREFSKTRVIPFIVKIDIEGFEKNLFSHNIEWIDEFPLIIIELHDWMLPKTANSESFLKAMAGRGRDFVFFGENVFSISNSLME